MTDLTQKAEFLLQLRTLRDKISSYKFIHVFVNDKFSKSIAEFIAGHFNAAEHCFVFIGGRPEAEFPLPQIPNTFSCPHPYCLAVSDTVEKVVLHGLYNSHVVQHLYHSPEIMQKSYWVPWGGDLHEAPDDPINNYVRSNFQGCAVNAYGKKVYQKKYGEGKAFFPFSLCFSSIDYNKIISTKIPPKSRVRIQVNNASHPSTLEVFAGLAKFKDENIEVTTVLSYGKQEWREKIIAEGKRIFADKFFPVTKYMPPDVYIKFLARNDIYIMNQHRPQGMTTAFTAMLLGQKVFMRNELREYLHDEGYTLYDSNSLDTLSFAELCAHSTQERNRRLAAKRFDETHIKQSWMNIFEHQNVMCVNE